uniref:Uncharacterized protein n=1 Tax=Arundo donax TaxID=35708 RepID=A0A0A9EAN6_ARUDO
MERGTGEGDGRRGALCGAGLRLASREQRRQPQRR